MIRDALLICLGAVALIWVAGSVVIGVLKPWRHFDRADRWLAWALLMAWLPMCLAVAIELGVEAWLDRRTARAKRRRHVR